MSTTVATRPPRRPAEYLAVGEVAGFLGISAWTLRNWDNGGKLPTLRHPKSGYRIYRRDDLAALLQHCVGGFISDSLRSSIGTTWAARIISSSSTNAMLSLPPA